MKIAVRMDVTRLARSLRAQALALADRAEVVRSRKMGIAAGKATKPQGTGGGSKP